MKERILTNWTFTRALFVIMGTMVIVQSALNHEWFVVLFGAYFAAMGLFAFGCASGGCFGGNCATASKENSNASKEDVEYEEVKPK
ncbi:MAG: hypothetical protein R3277_03880 [Brumimicrobium sp.]|nr:hypothetical protein [Brumimicrobium sp.]